MREFDTSPSDTDPSWPFLTYRYLRVTAGLLLFFLHILVALELLGAGKKKSQHLQVFCTTLNPLDSLLPEALLVHAMQEHPNLTSLLASHP